MTTKIDIAALRRDLGRKLLEHDEAAAAPMHSLALTFDREDLVPERGQPVPPGWHLAYFLPRIRRAGLGPDGAPMDTGVIPPMPLPRRMYAGATLTFHAPIVVGDMLRRETEFTDLQQREGGSGLLLVAEVTRRIYTGRGLALTEQARTVFREAVPAGATSAIPRREAPPPGLPWRRTIATDPVTLFRYSAVTFNAHRIHYDHPYATKQEGYPGLVVHGPFSQQCLLDLLRDNTPGQRIASFSMRARAPLFETAPFTVQGRPTQNGNGAELWAAGPEGTIAMQAEATLAPAA